MPHVIIKLQSGRSEQQKVKIAEEVTVAVMSGANCTEQAVSVSIEDIDANDWVEKVYKPDIIQKRDTLYKSPGYDLVAVGAMRQQDGRFTVGHRRHGRSQIVCPEEVGVIDPDDP
jgi:4-oxalocrotonate tautomerase